MADSPPAIWVDVTPALGGTVNVPVGDARVPVRLCINNSVQLIGTITLAWPITGVVDGQQVSINCGAAITGVAHTAEVGGSMRGGAASFLTGSNGIYVFRKANLTWYKFT